MTTELNNLQWIVKRKISHSVFVGLVLSTFLRKFPEKLGEGFIFYGFFLYAPLPRRNIWIAMKSSKPSFGH